MEDPPAPPVQAFDPMPPGAVQDDGLEAVGVDPVVGRPLAQSPEGVSAAAAVTGSDSNRNATNRTIRLLPLVAMAPIANARRSQQFLGNRPSVAESKVLLAFPARSHHCL